MTTNSGDNMETIDSAIESATDTSSNHVPFEQPPSPQREMSTGELCSAVDSLLDAGTLMLQSLRQKRANLLGELSNLEAVIAKIAPSKAASAAAKRAYTKRAPVVAGMTNEARVLAVLPTDKDSRMTSRQITEAAGIRNLPIGMTTVSALYQAHKVGREKVPGPGVVKYAYWKKA